MFQLVVLTRNCCFAGPFLMSGANSQTFHFVTQPVFFLRDPAGTHYQANQSASTHLFCSNSDSDSGRARGHPGHWCLGETAPLRGEAFGCWCMYHSLLYRLALSSWSRV